jgi:hypothetical protein
MDRSQTFRRVQIWAKWAVVIWAAAVPVWVVYSVWRNRRYGLAQNSVFHVGTARLKLSRDLDKPVRQGEPLTPAVAVTALQDHVKFLNSFNSKDVPEEYAVAFRDYAGSCKELLSYLEGHSSDQATLDSSTKIMNSVLFKDEPPPGGVPEPVLKRVQAVQDAERRLHALSERDGIEPRKAD